MAKKIKFAPQKDDIPVWFMTYSDVITLLMTFFILLLTFSTTEPERFEKVQTSTFSSGGATGFIGGVIDGPPPDAWISRVRPNASRIAMRGAEMPPIMSAPATQSFGQGLMSLDPKDRKHNELTSHFFDVDFNRLFDDQGELTSQGKLICNTLSVQLRDLPFQASLRFTDANQSDQVITMMSYLFENRKTRPGQLAMTVVQADDLPSQKLRIMIQRYIGDIE